MKLKFLHVGNVAQNGYINASILRSRGHDCDLVAPDLYHSGSSPEWYEMVGSDADPAVLGGDPFFPNFYALGRAMPQVGDWVAHGPFLPALITLLLRRRGDPRAHLARSVLSYLRFKTTLQRTTDPFGLALAPGTFEDQLARLDLPPRLRARIRLGRMAEDFWTEILARVRLQEDSPYVSHWRPPLPQGVLENYFPADHALRGLVHGLRARGLAEALFIEFPAPMMDYAHTERHGFTAKEAAPYLWASLILRDLAASYDVSIFYGDSSKFAFAAGIEGYWALEHGTIRTLPFYETVDSRMLAAGFQNAARVFLTNTDYISASPRLEFTTDQRIYFPHPFDEAPALAFRNAHVARRDPARTVFFCPARQEWASKHPDMVKGNDLYFRAGRMLLDRGRADFQFVCIDWGVDREASRKLIEELGLGDHVRWSPMLPKRALWTAMMDAHAVIDQFHLSAMGGVTFETLALGRRLISRDDGINNATFFEEAPPILAAATTEQIASRMLAVMDDKEDTAGLGQAGLEWVQRHHSAERICALQLSAYESFAKRTNLGIQP